MDPKENFEDKNNEAEVVQSVATDTENKEGDTGSLKNDKLVSYLGYVIPIFFFLPLVLPDLKGNKFAAFHANQQLLLLMVLVVGHTIGSAFHSMFMMSFINLAPIINLAALVFMIIGIINVHKNEQKELPLIGGFKLL